jgi:hypothetical protein
VAVRIDRADLNGRVEGGWKITCRSRSKADKKE